MPLIRFNPGSSPSLGGWSFTSAARLTWPQKFGVALIVVIVAILAVLALAAVAAVAVVGVAAALLYRAGCAIAGLLPGRGSTLPAPIDDGRRNVRVVVRDVEGSAD